MAAEFVIGVGADISVMQLELVKAQNLLKQFESQAKKSLSVGELSTLNTNIYNTRTQIAGLQQQMAGVSKPTGDASQSLINFSRIAQDAPYGIMGIANNLNPMVESFQRLAKTEGGTKAALGAMVSGLAGPAGIGVAIGVVSSLAVTFSKDIISFFKGPTEELEKFRDELKKVAADINKIIGQEQTKRTKGVLLTELIVGGNATQQQEALKQLKDLYKESDAIKNAKLGQDQAYYTNLVNLAAAQSGAIGQEKNNLTQLDLLYAKQIENNKKRNAELAKITGVAQGSGLSFNKVISVEDQRAAVNKTFDLLGNDIKNNIAKLENLTRTELGKITSVATTDKKSGGVEKKNPFIEDTKQFESELKAQDKLRASGLVSQAEYLDNIYKLYESYIGKIAKINTKPASDKYEQILPKFIQLELDKNYRDAKAGIDKVLGSYKEEEMVDPEIELIAKTKKTQEEYQKWYSTNLKGIQNQTAKNYDKKKELTDKEKQDMEDLAMTISNTATSSIVGMFEAIQNGESVLDSLGNMLGKLAEQLIQAALQAAIFAGIMSLMTGGIGGGGLSFAGYFKKAFGMAEGGIVTGPTNALIGEGNESEAVMPLTKLNGMLNTTFKAGAMNGNAAGGGNGQFVLRGQDLVLALQRSNSALTLRR